MVSSFHSGELGSPRRCVTKTEMLSRRMAVSAELRRHGRQYYDNAERFMAAVSGEDSHLLTDYYVHGHTLYRLAKSRQTNAQTIQRRIASIKARIDRPIFRAAIIFADKLPEPVRQVVFGLYVEGKAMQTFAQEQHITLAVVRRLAAEGKRLLMTQMLTEIGRPEIATLLEA